jgi:hypothetical protein
MITVQDGSSTIPTVCPVGKPRKRWLVAVKEDSYQILKWRDWEVKAQDREEWRSRIKKTKACFGM